MAREFRLLPGSPVLGKRVRKDLEVKGILDYYAGSWPSVRGKDGRSEEGAGLAWGFVPSVA